MVCAQSHRIDSAREATVTTSKDHDSADAELWDEVRIQPVKVALPGAVVGYTLRAYRPAGEVTPTEVAREEADDPFERRPEEQEPDLTELVGVEVDERPGAEEAPEAEEPAPQAVEAEESVAAPGPADDEEVPLFLSHRGRLLLFGSPESLVAFINSDAPHDLAQLDTWDTVVKRVRASDIAPSDQDTYELDLVVENLRGGHDAWDLNLLISAGEFARDIGFALRIEAVIAAMAPESPLDDLDEALRAAAAGGFKAIRGRRRLRGIGAQQASLGWRTVIGKISAAVDWRE